MWRYARAVSKSALVLLAVVLGSSSCGGQSTGQDPPPSSMSPPPPPPSPLTITTAALPGGQVGKAYSTALSATGGTTPYQWSVTGGALPSGLRLDGTTGAITGTPAATANHLALTFGLKDAGNPTQTASVGVTLSVSPATISIAISPGRAGLTVGQQLALTATTNDYAGVSWTIAPASGSFNSGTSLSGSSVTLTAAQSPGVYTVTATSVTEPAESSSIQVGVTDLAGVYTYHQDLARDGANTQEYALTPSNVSTSSFGKLFSCTVDGAIYAQPLWVANLDVGGAVRNAVFVATAHDSLYAFDADAIPCKTLWQVSLIDSSHGGTGGEVTVPAGTRGFLVGTGNGDMTPEAGVTGTPVIDPTTDTLYVVSKSMNAAGTQFYQRLHAIDLTSGSERAGSPVLIDGTYPGTGDGGSTVAFDAQKENQRAGLALVGGTVYIAWGSHEDAKPFYGWLMGYTYDGASFTRADVLNTAPNAGEGGVWMNGTAPGADSQGHLYVLTGNAVFDATRATAPNDDYGDSMLQLSPTLKVLQYFTPSDQESDAMYNNDFGAGGAAVLADLPAGSPVTHLVIGGGKDGNLYVLDRDALGGYGDSGAWQEINVGTGGAASGGAEGVIFATGAFWNDIYYLAGVGGPLRAYQLDPSTAKLSLQAASTTPGGGFGFPGSTPSVSASGDTNGIVWALDGSQFCTNLSPGCGPAVLHAYEATDVAKELWNSSMSSADAAGNAVKFVVPVIANGKVYVGTRGNNRGGTYGTTSASGELDVYGLKP